MLIAARPDPPVWLLANPLEVYGLDGEQTIAAV